MDTREIVSTVRDALEAAQQARGTAPTSVVQELESESQHAMRVIQDLIDGMARQRRLWLTNDMSGRLENERYEFTGMYSRERFAEIKALFDAFAAWVEAPLVVAYADTEMGMPEISIPPIVIVSRRENPESLWGITLKPQEPIVMEPVELIEIGTEKIGEHEEVL